MNANRRKSPNYPVVLVIASLALAGSARAQLCLSPTEKAYLAVFKEKDKVLELTKQPAGIPQIAGRSVREATIFGSAETVQTVTAEETEFAPRDAHFDAVRWAEVADRRIAQAQTAWSVAEPSGLKAVLPVE